MTQTKKKKIPNKITKKDFAEFSRIIETANNRQLYELLDELEHELHLSEVCIEE
jgi:hypothetical protein